MHTYTLLTVSLFPLKPHFLSTYLYTYTLLFDTFAYLFLSFSLSLSIASFLVDTTLFFFFLKKKKIVREGYLAPLPPPLSTIFLYVVLAYVFFLGFSSLHLAFVTED